MQDAPFRNFEGYKKEHLRLPKGAQVTKRSKMLLFVTLKVTKRSTGYKKEQYAPFRNFEDYKKEHLRLRKGAQVRKRSNMLLFVTLKITKRSTLGYEKEHRLQKGAVCSIS